MDLNKINKVYKAITELDDTLKERASGLTGVKKRQSEKHAFEYYRILLDKIRDSIKEI